MVLCDIFPDYGKPGAKTGNVFISGLPDMGAEGCQQQLLKDILAEREPVVLFHDCMSDRQREWLNREAEAAGYTVLDISDRRSRGWSFDLFGDFKYVDEMADAVYSFLYDASDSTDGINLMCRYLQDSILALDAVGEEISIRGILGMRVEDVRDGILRSGHMTEPDRRSEADFLVSKDVYRCWSLLDDRSRKLSGCGAIDLLSGTNKLEDILDGPVLLTVSSSAGLIRAEDTYSFLLNGILFMLVNVFRKKADPFHVFIHNTEKIKNELLESLLDMGAEASCQLPVCICEQSVSRAIRCHEDRLFQRMETYLIFKNHEGEFWSGFMGTVKMPDLTMTYTRHRSRVMNLLGGVIPRMDGKYEGTSIHRVEKPRYEAREFSALREKQMIFYRASSNKIGRKQLDW